MKKNFSKTCWPVIDFLIKAILFSGTLIRSVGAKWPLLKATRDDIIKIDESNTCQNVITGTLVSIWRDALGQGNETVAVSGSWKEGPWCPWAPVGASGETGATWSGRRAGTFTFKSFILLISLEKVPLVFSWGSDSWRQIMRGWERLAR